MGVPPAGAPVGLGLRNPPGMNRAASDRPLAKRAVGSQHHNAVDEAYAKTRHLLGPLLDVLGEGEIVHNRDSELVDRSQSGGDEAGDLS